MFLQQIVPRVRRTCFSLFYLFYPRKFEGKQCFFVLKKKNGRKEMLNNSRYTLQLENDCVELSSSKFWNVCLILKTEINLLTIICPNKIAIRLNALFDRSGSLFSFNFGLFPLPASNSTFLLDARACTYLLRFKVILLMQNFSRSIKFY